MMNYLRLFRFDVALIAFFSYLFGASLADSYNSYNIIVAFAVTFISTNFIYAFNSWADKEIDLLNKPYRPIPSGKIEPHKALVYSIILFILSCIYPFFIYTSSLTLILFLLLPFLGYIYSGNPFRFRRYSISSIIIVSTGLVIPVSLGYFMNITGFYKIYFFLYLLIYCTAIVPLKDIEDIEGDIKNDMENLFHKFGRKLLYFSFLILLIDFLLVFFFMNDSSKYYLFLFIISSIIIIGIFSFKKNLTKLYRIIIFTVIIEVFIIYIVLNLSSINSKLNYSIEKGMNFLYKNQISYGEFFTYISSDKLMMTDFSYDSSPFATTFVLYSISFVKDKRVAEITDKGINFFLEEHENGMWRFWSSRNVKRIDPDLDDLSCISYILEKHNRYFSPNKDIVYRYKSNNGLFYTWIRELAKNNDIDCAVNSNILLYLGENEKTIDTCASLNNIILADREYEYHWYYTDTMAFYYMFSRAYFNDVKSLGKSREEILKRILSIQKSDGSFGDELSTAFAICSLLNFNYQKDEKIKKAIVFLINKQNADGSWRKIAFFTGPEPCYPHRVWWGSEEFTTAICLEAIARYASEKY